MVVLELEKKNYLMLDANQIYQPGRIESKSSRYSSSQTITIRISEP
jgi:hypothetical protein